MYPLLDGGWGWAAVVAGFLSCLLTTGLYRSGGVVYVAAMDAFQESHAVAAWIPMVSLIVVFMTAPVGTTLSKRFPSYKITLCGDVITTAGLLLCYFSHRVELVFLSWGIMCALGSSLSMMQTYSAVGQCFEQKRPLANGIVITGGALGAIAFPPLLQLLTDSYGLNGMALILAGVSSHYYIVTYLLFLVSRQTKEVSVDESAVHPDSAENNNGNDDEESMLIRKRSMTRSRSVNDQYYCSFELSGRWVLSEEMRSHETEDETVTKPKSTTSCCRSLADVLDLSVFLNCTFLVNACASAIQSALSFETAIILLDFGQTELGMSRLQSATLISIMSAADLCGRFLTGIGLTYCKRYCPNIEALCCLVLLLNTGAYACVGSSHQYAVVAGCCVMVGLCYGTFRIIYFEVLASSQPAKKFPTALGLSEMIKATALLATGPLLGRLRDVTGGYSTTFHVFSGLCSLAAILWIVLVICKRKMCRNEDSETEAT